MAPSLSVQSLSLSRRSITAHIFKSNVSLFFRPSNLTQNFERSSSVFKVGSLDIDTDWTDELGAILDEELEECDEDGNIEVHPFKMLCSAIEHLDIWRLQGWAQGWTLNRLLDEIDKDSLFYNAWSELLILDHIHNLKYRTHFNLSGVYVLENGQKFELINLAVLGEKNNIETFHKLYSKLETLKFDSMDYEMVKLVILSNPEAPGLQNKNRVQANCDLVKGILQKHCNDFYSSVPNKFDQLMNILPDLRSMALMGEEFLYSKHMEGCVSKETVLFEYLLRKKELAGQQPM